MALSLACGLLQSCRPLVFLVMLLNNAHRPSLAGSPSPGEGSGALGGRAGTAGIRILGIIVSYDPDRDALGALVESLVAAGVDALIVDNSESEVGCVSAVAVAAAYGAEAVCNPRNVGVAEAQNIGLRQARERGYTHALLLDQDSVLEGDAVAQLASAFQALREAGQPVAAVGASFVDPRTGQGYPFVRLRQVRMGKVWPRPGEVVECDLLISSGCLIALDALTAVGEMDSSLFIDYVDIEWCVRARAAGYRVFGVADARMHHTIGERTVNVLGRPFNLHGAVRHYYFIRNALLFARKPYLDARWRLHLGYRAIGQLVLFGVLAKGRRERLPWLLRGLWDGLLGRSGRLGGPDGLAHLSPLRRRPAPIGEAAAASAEDRGVRQASLVRE